MVTNPDAILSATSITDLVAIARRAFDVLEPRRVHPVGGDGDVDGYAPWSSMTSRSVNCIGPARSADCFLPKSAVSGRFEFSIADS